LLLATAPGSASSGTVIQVGTATVPAGQNASTNVIASIASNDSVNGFDVTLAFDPAVVTAASVTLSQGWTALPVASPIDNSGGTVRVAGFQLGTGCGSGSSCPLFAVSWHGVAGGSSTVRVSVQQLAGSNGGAAGTLSSVAAVNGSVTVPGAPAAPSSSPKASASVSASATATKTPATATNTSVATSTASSTAQVSATSAPVTATIQPDSSSSSTAVAGTAAAVSATAATPAETAVAPGTSTPEPPAAVATTAVTQPVVIVTQAVPTASETTPTQQAGVLGTVSPDIPRPPATGTGGTTYGAQGNSMRLAGIALIVLSALILFDRGVRFTNSRRALAQVSGRDDGSVRARGNATSAAVPHIDDVVDRYLSDAETRAAEGDDAAPTEDPGDPDR